MGVIHLTLPPMPDLLVFNVFCELPNITQHIHFKADFLKIGNLVHEIVLLLLDSNITQTNLQPHYRNGVFGNV